MGQLTTAKGRTEVQAAKSSDCTSVFWYYFDVNKNILPHISPECTTVNWCKNSNASHIRLFQVSEIIPTLLRLSPTPYFSGFFLHKTLFLRAVFYVLFCLSSLVLQKVLQLSQKNSSVRLVPYLKTYRQLIYRSDTLLYSLFNWFNHKYRMIVNG